MDSNVLLIGGGGHCHSVLDTILSDKKYKEIGVVARDRDNYVQLQKDEFVAPYLVGVDSNLPGLLLAGWNNAFVTLGSVGKPFGRIRIYQMLIDIGFTIPVIADSTAIVSENARIGGGTFIGKNAIVNAGCDIGECVIINTGAILEHDCTIEKYAHICPGTVLCGGVKVGEYSHVGAASVVRQNIKIGSEVIIGIGSVIVRDIPDNVKAYGNPCKVVE